MPKHHRQRYLKLLELVEPLGWEVLPLKLWKELLRQSVTMAIESLKKDEAERVRLLAFIRSRVRALDDPSKSVYIDKEFMRQLNMATITKKELRKTTMSQYKCTFGDTSEPRILVNDFEQEDSDEDEPLPVQEVIKQMLVVQTKEERNNAIQEVLIQKTMQIEQFISKLISQQDKVNQLSSRVDKKLAQLDAQNKEYNRNLDVIEKDRQ